MIAGRSINSPESIFDLEFIKLKKLWKLSWTKWTERNPRHIPYLMIFFSWIFKDIVWHVRRIQIYRYNYCSLCKSFWNVNMPFMLMWLEIRRFRALTVLVFPPFCLSWLVWLHRTMAVLSISFHSFVGQGESWGSVSPLYLCSWLQSICWRDNSRHLSDPSVTSGLHLIWWACCARGMFNPLKYPEVYI